jgi:LPXTG-site transpeptidase (sortase) family protein
MSIRPIVIHDPAPCSARRHRRRGDTLCWAQNAVFVAVCSIAGLVTFFAGYSVYLQILETRSPSGHVYFRDSGGSRVYLVQPTAIVTPLPVSAVSPGPLPEPLHASAGAVPPDGFMHAEATMPPVPTSVVAEARLIAPTPRADVPLPPLGLEAPAIGLSVPVRMVTSSSLPRGPYAGWFFRSAFPATAGNVVLLGHVDGPAAVFARLGELQPGDEVHVLTEGMAHIYIVEWTAIVEPSAVEMLGPIEHPVLTLITCFGEWDAARREYDFRLVVRARYAAVETRIASN